MTRQIERLRPEQITAALAQRSLIYLPLGTVEWHCHHLPVGLDALTAQGLCLRAAEQTGGLVWPPLYYGTGGDHGGFPWTVMMPDASEIETMLRFTLTRLAALQVAEVVLFSGHFADTQLLMIDRIAETWNAQGRAPQVRAISVNRLSVPELPPDHAGLFETSLMRAIDPDLVRMAALSDAPDLGSRMDPASPLWGIIGADPRDPAPVGDAQLLQRLVQSLVQACRA